MKFNLPKIVALVILLVNIFILNSLSVLGFKNRPVSDDYCIAVASEKFKDTSLVKTLRYSYLGYTGRLSLFITHSKLYEFFNRFSADHYAYNKCAFFNSKNYIDKPSQLVGSLSLYLLLISLCIFLYYLLYPLFLNAHLFLVNLSCAILWLTCSLNGAFSELFYWVSGWVTYTWPTCILLLFVSRLIHLDRLQSRPSLIEVICYIPLLLYLSLFNELLTLMLIISGVVLIIVNIYKKQHRLSAIYALTASISILSFYIMYSSPITVDRATRSTPRTLSEVMINMPGLNLAILKQLYISAPFIWFIIIALLLAWSNEKIMNHIKNNTSNLRRSASILLVVSLFWQLVFSAAILRVGEQVPQRTQLSFHLLQLAAVIVFVLSIAPFLYSKAKIYLPLQQYRKGLILVMLMVSIIQALQSNRYQNSSLDVLSYSRMKFIYDYSKWHDRTFIPSVRQGVEGSQELIMVETMTNGFRGHLSQDANNWINNCIEDFYMINEMQTSKFLE